MTYVSIMTPRAPQTASEILPFVYDDLRMAAKAQVERETTPQTLQGTALLHEAYLRVKKDEQQWNGPGHFFAAVTEVMRRILVENARRKKRVKHGGALDRQPFDETALADPASDDDKLLELDDALAALASHKPEWAELVKLRYFIGLSIPDTAKVLGVSPRTADFWWAEARAWLLRRLSLDFAK